jgi:hypothetical protein
LAFFEEEFLNINCEDNKYGTNDVELFETYTLQSMTMFEVALSGIEIMSNFEFEGVKKEERCETLEIALTDCLKEAYISSFLKEPK